MSSVPKNHCGVLRAFLQSSLTGAIPLLFGSGLALLGGLDWCLGLIPRLGDGATTPNRPEVLWDTATNFATEWYLPDFPLGVAVWGWWKPTFTQLLDLCLDLLVDLPYTFGNMFSSPQTWPNATDMCCFLQLVRGAPVVACALFAPVFGVFTFFQEGVRH